MRRTQTFAEVIFGIVILSGCSSPRPAAMSPTEANRSLTNLDMQTIIGRCGPVTLINSRVLKYPFGSLVFDGPAQNDSVLMDAYVNVPGETHAIDWTNIQKA